MRNSPYAQKTPTGRRAFTIAELTLALGILAVALTMVVQVGVQTLRERERVAARQAAQEQVVNVLESARACPWDKLDATWAKAQSLPEVYVKSGWKLEVKVEPEASRPRIKRVTAAVQRVPSDSIPVPQVQLVGLFADRTKGEKP